MLSRAMRAAIMAETYDLILQGGTVVRQDGEGVRSCKVTWDGELPCRHMEKRRGFWRRCHPVRIVQRKLLARQIDGKFAVVNAGGKAFGIAGGGILAVGRNQLCKGGEQTGLRHVIVLDAIEAGFRPCLMQVAERHLFLLLLRHRLAGWNRVLCAGHKQLKNGTRGAVVPYLIKW